MIDPWVRLQTAAGEAIDWIWYDLAKNGRETAALAPLALSAKAAGWLAASMSQSDDDIVRKLGAMLAGLIDDDEQTELLTPMLDNERRVFLSNTLVGNSVTEDIMFAATRWSSGKNGRRVAGIHTLAEIVSDALSGTPWNTSHWAAANLFAATDGNHQVLAQLAVIKPEQLSEQMFLNNFAEALRSGDKAAIDRYATPPSSVCELPADDPNRSLAEELWSAAREADASLAD